MLVKNWMSKEIVTVDADDSMQNAIYILQEQNIKILPVMENEKIVSAITIPGNKAGHQCPVIIEGAPIEIIDPHSGVGTLTPAPTKLNPAVINIPPPIITDKSASRGVSAFCIIWKYAILNPQFPAALAASTKGLSRKDSTSARACRKLLIWFTATIASIIFIGLGPSAATKSRANTKMGNA